MNASTERRGLLQRLRSYLSGDRDEVGALIRRMEREGSGFAKLANGLSFVLVVLFSAGSLLALFGETVTFFVVRWSHGVIDIPSGIILGVSFLLVVCMDMAMLWASIQLRLLSSRKAPLREKWIHFAVLLTVATVEAGTYLFMCVQYEHPTTGAAWALIIARSVMAPILAIYLTLAKPVPVTPRDILYHVEMASGKSLLEEVVRTTSDPNVPLAKKMQLYAASAIMTVEDRKRLDDMMIAVQTMSYLFPSGMIPPDGPPGAGERVPGLDDGRTVEADRERSDSPTQLRLVQQRRRRRRANGKDSGKRPALTREEKRDLEAFAYLDAKPTMKQWELQELVHCRPTTARSIMARWRIRNREQAAAAMEG